MQYLVDFSHRTQAYCIVGKQLVWFCQYSRSISNKLFRICLATTNSNSNDEFKSMWVLSILSGAVPQGRI